MDDTDIDILRLVQADSRQSNAQLADAVGVSVSTANERVRKLAQSGHIKSWQAVLDPAKVGAEVCAFLMIDVAYAGEQATCEALCALDAVQELHHISGAHSYLLKVRVRDVKALNRLLSEDIKPLEAVLNTHSLMVLHTSKENSAVAISL